MLLNCSVGEDSWVLCTSRRSNQSILKELSPEWSLEGLMLKLKLQYFGYHLWRTDSFEKTLMLGKMKAGGEGDDRGWKGWMAGHWLDRHEFEQAPGIGDGQGGLACCSPWGLKESDRTEQPNWTVGREFATPSDSGDTRGKKIFRNFADVHLHLNFDYNFYNKQISFLRIKWSISFEKGGWGGVWQRQEGLWDQTDVRLCLSLAFSISMTLPAFFLFPSSLMTLIVPITREYCWANFHLWVSLFYSLTALPYSCPRDSKDPRWCDNIQQWWANR